jgi:hypothetical protein
LRRPKCPKSSAVAIPTAVVFHGDKPMPLPNAEQDAKFSAKPVQPVGVVDNEDENVGSKHSAFRRRAIVALASQI